MKGYTYRKLDTDYWMVINPSGVLIASTLTWRTARKIADAMNHYAVWGAHCRDVEEDIRKYREEEEAT